MIAPKKPKRQSKNDAMIEALLAGDMLGRPSPYRSPFAGARPTIAKNVAPSQVPTMPMAPVDTSGFAGLGAIGGAAGAGAEPVGSDAWAVRHGGLGALAWRKVLEGLSGSLRKKA